MATVNAGSFAFNYNEVYSRFGVLNDLRFGDVSFGYTLVSRSATQIVYTTPDGTTLTFTGTNFTTGGTLDDPAALTTYTLTGITETTPAAVTVWSITGFSFSQNTDIIQFNALTGNDQVIGSAGNDVLWGGFGNDTINGGAGADQMEGDIGDDTYVVDNVADRIFDISGIDTVQSAVTFSLSGPNVDGTVEHLTLTGAAAINGTGTDFANVIRGNAGNNVLDGLGGTDTLDGGLGSDVLRGGTSNDTYVIDVAGDVIVELPGQGNDTVKSAVDFNVTNTNIENVTLTGAAVSATGDGGNNTLTGNAGANILDGGGGFDTLRGGLGNDTYMVDNPGDQVFEESAAGGTDLVIASLGMFQTYFLDDFNSTFVENLTLTGTQDFTTARGNAQNNTLTGNSGINTLDGGFGADTMAGGAGDDDYVVDQTGDVVLELLNGGLDEVFSFSNTVTAYTLPVNVENLYNFAGVGMALTGNDLNNYIEGSGGNDVLNGMAGADTMVGNGGVNTYVVDNAGDVVSDDGSYGDGDTVQSSISYNLFSTFGVDNLTLIGAAAINGTGDNNNNVITGNGADNTLEGNFGNDTLDGGLGNDTLRGGFDNDTLVVNAAGDVVIELPGEGNDTVKSAISYSIQHNLNLENVTLTGAAIFATGNSLFNTLTGNDGANVLDGREGGDFMAGGLGNDAYFVDDFMDFVTETTAGAAGGVDQVTTALSFHILGDNVENLVTTSTQDFFGYGNVLANNLSGNAGNDFLNGLGGADTMTGFDGNDQYFVDNTGDAVVEAAGNGLDTVFTSVTFTLPVNVEVLVNSGGVGPMGVEGQAIFLPGLVLTGNALDNSILVTHQDHTNDTLDGMAGADRMEGGYGDDLYKVDNPGDVVLDRAGGGIDRVESLVSFSLDGTRADDLVLLGAAVEGIGSLDHNRITGNALANLLSGHGGDDVLDGGAGADDLRGGEGNDEYVVDSAGDLVSEAPGQGFDTVRSSVNFDLGAAGEVERLFLTGAAVINGIGNSLANILIGNDAANVLDGGMGGDSMQGGLGSDTYHVDDFSDFVQETVGGAPGGIDLVVSSVSFDLQQHSPYLENLTLVPPQAGGLVQAIDGRGNELNNVIIGNAAANLLDGRTGADRMEGQLGDDTYFVDNPGDVVVETPGAGTDTVKSAVSLVLPVEVENLFLLAVVGALNATGNAGVNLLVGNNFDNVLDGMALADTMDGGYGNDTYRVDSLGDVVLEGQFAGVDTIQTSVNLPGLANNVENLTLIGPATNGVGNGLDNVLTGNALINNLQGGYGNDTYVVDATGDVVFEFGGSGFDTVRSSATYTLPGNVERLVLTGKAAIIGIGNPLNNDLFGNDAANVLDGMGGLDFMVGGAGNDVYFVDLAGDAVSEDNLLAGGTDLVNAFVSYTITDADVENLTLLPGGAALNATGNDSRNVLTGNELANTLDGLGGADTMIGGTGDDFYRVDVSGDRVIELAGGGHDFVESGANYTLPAEVEDMVLIGGALNGRGNALSNFLIGNVQSNVLNGEGGADFMNGGLGNDTYFFDHGGDQAFDQDLAPNGIDTIISTVDVSLAGAQNAAGGVEHVTLIGTAVLAVGNHLNNTLTGNALNNTLIGSSGNDTLNGGRGADFMDGGFGADFYFVDSTQDQINEIGGELDTVVSTVSYTLSPLIEDLILDGNRNINGTGNATTNFIGGNGGNNVLDGMGGVDQLFGNNGDDVIVWDSNDLFRSGGSGFDTLRAATAGANISPVGGLGFDSFERVDLTGTGNNTLVIDAQDVMDMSDNDTLIVNGNAGDTVDLAALWNTSPVQVLTLDGVLYTQYQGILPGPDPFILIQQGITVI